MPTRTITTDANGRITVAYTLAGHTAEVQYQMPTLAAAIDLISREVMRVAAGHEPDHDRLAAALAETVSLRPYAALRLVEAAQ